MKDRFIIVPLLVFSIFVVYFSDYWSVFGKAGIWAKGEEEFSKPVDIVWRGEIISTMASGSCVGLKGDFDDYLWAVACLPDVNSSELWKFEGTIKVTGKWFGITCAYKNTIFGECVPDVRIESIEQ